MAKSMTDRIADKRLSLVRRTSQILGVSEETAVDLLNIGRQQSLRVNTLKPVSTLLSNLEKLGWTGNKFEWYSDGLTVDAGLEAIRDSLLVASGNVYIQNAASWLPALLLDAKPGDAILDVCAAPGGKTSHIAALANNQAHITANDNSRPRLAKLRANLERLGVMNVDYALYDAAYLARKLDGTQFDKILLDAPCSGEGMITLSNDRDIETWSVAHIKRLQRLQKRLITQAWQLLKPGGALVYSTCTMAPEENEAVVDYLLRSHPDAVVRPVTIPLPNRVQAVMEWNGRAFSPGVAESLRLSPSSQIEAFFVCCLYRKAESD